MAKKTATLRVRLPDDLKVWVEALAKKNMRSMSAEVAIVLRDKMLGECGASNDQR